MKVTAENWRFVRSVVALLLPLLLPRPAWAAVAVHSEAHFNRSLACATTGITSNTFAVVSGDLIWVICDVSGTSAACATPSDTSQPGLSWHAVAASQCFGVGSVGSNQMYWAVSGATETDQIKEITATGAGCGIDALDLSGANTTTPVAQYTTCNNGSSTSPATQNFGASTASTSLEIGGLMTNGGPYTYVSGPTNSYTTLTENNNSPGSLGAYNTGKKTTNGYGFGISASIAWNGFAAEVQAPTVARSGTIGLIGASVSASRTVAIAGGSTLALAGDTVSGSRGVAAARSGSAALAGASISASRSVGSIARSAAISLAGEAVSAARSVRAAVSATINLIGAAISGIAFHRTAPPPFVVSNAPMSASLVVSSPINSAVIIVAPMTEY